MIDLGEGPAGQQQLAGGVVHEVAREAVPHPTQLNAPLAAEVDLRQVVVRDQVVRCGQRLEAFVAVATCCYVRLRKVVDVVADDGVVVAAGHGRAGARGVAQRAAADGVVLAP